MLKSMTGFGAAAIETEDYKVSVEVKAVNQRFLEINFHMGRQLSQWEDALRKCIKGVAARGKLDVYVSFADKRESQAHIRVNKGLVLAYQQALNEMSDVLHLARPDDVQAFAAFPDVLEIESDSDISGMKPLLLQAMEQALANFDAMRAAEGSNIEADFAARLKKLLSMRAKVSELAPGIVHAYRDHLQQTIAEALQSQTFDETRLIQETAIYADRVDITEELVRLGSHFQQFQQIVAQSAEPVGRKLDFLIQEINRETNTIGSKANSTEAAQLVVDMKSEIEKLREQVQNIE
ncbi:TIGR00255 family protein [Selenomonas ruminantium]|uniref:TIGR00255 family protein n=1 Tax=Selenomonas ruminantium TaxID=971 RepID=A0A1I3DCE7_SELRU|nr:YicC/YloC family endoribonuclease [Selenomonas ruminantium]SFH84249.1 TIGR00255 family protein [Selenomonas ruminantium]